MENGEVFTFSDRAMNDKDSNLRMLSLVDITEQYRNTETLEEKRHLVAKLNEELEKLENIRHELKRKTWEYWFKPRYIWIYAGIFVILQPQTNNFCILMKKNDRMAALRAVISSWTP